MQRSAYCRSRRELSNEYLLATFGFDTAENEPCKVCPLSAYRSPRYDSGGEHKQNRIYDRLEALEEKAESMKENLQLSARKFTEGEKAMRAELPSWVRHRHRRESFLETDSPPEGAEIPEVAESGRRTRAAERSCVR